MSEETNMTSTQPSVEVQAVVRPRRRCGYGYNRHWFTLRGHVGDYVAKCIRCGEPNPKLKKAV